MYSVTVYNKFTVYYYKHLEKLSTYGHKFVYTRKTVQKLISWTGNTIGSLECICCTHARHQTKPQQLKKITIKKYCMDSYKQPD